MKNLPKLALLPLVFLLGLSCLSHGQPYEAYPIDKQLPPVARVGEQFSFQLSNDTYKSSFNEGTQITYQAYDLPDWLSFDSSSRTLSGTANSSDLGDDIEKLYFSFTLEGTDPSDKSKFNDTQQLVLSNYSSINLANNFNLLALLKNYGPTNGKSGLILSPKEIFNVTFDRTTFTSESTIVAYYGRVEQYNAPLPNWVVFDQNNLKFSGTAPVVNSDIAPQLTYSLVLIATDIEGFAGISVPFDLVIGAHELTTSIQNSLVVNVTSEGEFNYNLPMDYVYFDGDQIKSGDLGSVNLVDAPSWVKLDNTTLSGSMPLQDSSTSSNFSVAIYDKYSDVIYLNLMVESTSQLFAVSSLSNINATRGEWFEYSFLPSQFTDYSSTDVSVNYTNSTESHEWIAFKSSNLTLSGLVPDDFNSLSMDLIATSGDIKQNLDFQIIGMDSLTKQHNLTHNSTSSIASSSTSTSIQTSSRSMSTSHPSSPTTTASATTSAATSPLVNKNSSHKATAIACGVAIPLGLIALIAIVFLLFWRRRRSDKSNDKENAPNISGPDVNNPANRPNQAAGAVLADPFDDSNSSMTTNAQRLGALNAMKLDEASSTGSEASTIDEKRSSLESADFYHDHKISQSTEQLIQKPNENFFDPQNRSSSVYLDSEPANRKSWRYKLSPRKTNNGLLRDSCISSSTVSTTDFMNTIITDDRQLPKDPRKSTLGLRDSVFLDRNSPVSKAPLKSGVQFGSPKFVIPVSDEQSNLSSNYKSVTSPTSSSSDEFVPVKNGENYNWVHRPKPDRQPSGKRLVKSSNLGKVNVGQAAEVEGHVPEQI